MTLKRAVIIGASAPDTIKLIAAINRAGRDHIVIEGFLDDDSRKFGSTFMGYPILGPLGLLHDKLRNVCVVNNVARDMKTRQAVVSRLNSFPSIEHLTLIHPSVDANCCTVGQGCQIQEGVVLGAQSTVGDHCMLYAGCVIGHESVVNEFVFVANKAIVGARSTIGKGSFIGLSSVILPYLQVGPWSTVGAGSIVLRDVAAGSAVFGNPARVGVQPDVLQAEAS